MTPWTIAVFGAALIVAYLAIVPLYFLVQGTFVGQDGLTLGGFVRAFQGEAAIPEMMRNTLVFAIGSTLLGLILGTVVAYVQVRTDAPFKTLFFMSSIVPLIIPGILYTPSWIFLLDPNIGVLNSLLAEPLIGRSIFDPYSMGGMIWVHGLHNAPIAFLFMVAAFRGMDPSLEEAALASGASRMTLLRRITVPLVRPGLVAAALLLFVQGIESFEVPALLGVQAGIYVFTSRLFLETHTFPIDYAAAGALALTLLALAGLAAALGWWAVRNARGYQTITGKAFRPQPVHLGRGRPLVGGGVIAYFIITTFLPLAILIYASLLPYYQSPSPAALALMSFDTYREVFAMPALGRAVQNSLILGIGTATIVMILTAIVAWGVVRTQVPGRKQLDALTLTPLVIPGLVLGLAILFVYLRVPLPIYGTLLIMLISFTTQHLPYGMRFSSAAISQVSGELEESAWVSGASRAKTFRRILMPLMSLGLLAGWVYILIHSLRSLSTIILLYSPGQETLSVLIFQAFQNGEFTVLAAVGVIVMVILLALTGVAYRVGIKVGVKD